MRIRATMGEAEGESWHPARRDKEWRSHYLRESLPVRRSRLSRRRASVAERRVEATGCAAPELSATLTLERQRPPANGDRPPAAHFGRTRRRSRSSSTCTEAAARRSSNKSSTKMNVTSNQDSFVVAGYPQGLIPDGTGYRLEHPGRAAHRWSPGTKELGERRQVFDFARRHPRAALRASARGVCTPRVSPVGRAKPSQLACDESQVFAAVAPVSGLRRPSPCPSTRAVPVIAFHGSADPVDPFAGHGEAYWTYSVPTAEKYWGEQDHCATQPTTSTPASGATLTDVLEVR